MSNTKLNKAKADLVRAVGGESERMPSGRIQIPEYNTSVTYDMIAPTDDDHILSISFVIRKEEYLSDQNLDELLNEIKK